jgi:diapolycopene oxygenase
MKSDASESKVVVIGGGLGGLSAAISLAADGYEVELVEKNDKLGGKLNYELREGFSFDLGPSIIILPEHFKRLFERAGKRMEEYVEFERLEPQWRSFFEDGTTLDLWSDSEQMSAELRRIGASPEEYQRFLDYSKGLHELVEQTYYRGADTIREMARGYGLIRLFRDADIGSTVRSAVERYVREPHVRDMLSFFIKYVGSSPYDAPAVLNVMPYEQVAFGLFYVKGGMYNLARGLAKLAEEVGVKVRLESEVVAIRKSSQSRRVAGVTLADQTEINADIVVSNMEVIPAYKRLLGLDAGIVRKYERRFEPSASGLVVHVGINRDYPELRHHNFFFARELKKHLDEIHCDKVLPDDPTIYLVCPTRTNPGLAPEGHHILKILPHIPHLTDNPPSAADYERLKQKVYDKLERMGLTDLRQHIVVESVLTPADIQRLYYSNKGSIYGVVSSRFKNLGFKAPKTSELYENLYFVGGSVNPGGGTPMVILSGQMVADRIAASR